MEKVETNANRPVYFTTLTWEVSSYALKTSLELKDLTLRKKETLETIQWSEAAWFYVALTQALPTKDGSLEGVTARLHSLISRAESIYGPPERPSGIFVYPVNSNRELVMTFEHYL